VGVTGTSPTLAGGGIDFSAVNTAGVYLATPGALATAINAQSQNFIQCMYALMPTDANWWSSTSGRKTLWNWAATDNFTSEADICSFEPKLNGSVQQLLVRFQTAIGTATSLNFSPVPAGVAGQICQIGAWRNDAGLGVSIRSPTGRNTETAARTTNAATITGLVAKVGCGPSWGTLSANDLSVLGDLRVYRAWAGALKTGGRAPLTVLEQDYLRNFAKFS
jgi:hypothetical protein